MGDEVRVEQWMVEAAREVVAAEDEGALFRSIRNEMEVTEGRRAGTDRDAMQRTYEALAAIIAKHAPKPLFRPGETVQYRYQPHVRGVIVEQADRWTVNWGTSVATYAGRYLESVEAADAD